MTALETTLRLTAFGRIIYQITVLTRLDSLLVYVVLDRTLAYRLDFQQDYRQDQISQSQPLVESSPNQTARGLQFSFATIDDADSMGGT
jgi:hypothetical protein